jgi:hypothetical protein
LVIAHSEGTLITAAALLSLQQRDLAGRIDRADPQIFVSPGHPDPAGTELAGVCWVTYGCMLRRIFTRAWPDQLPLDDLADLKRELEGYEPGAWAGRERFPLPPEGKVARWINFGRYTDYLGGRVFAELQAKPTVRDRCPERKAEQRRDDLFLWDPTRRWRYVGQVEEPRMWTHSFDYQSDMEDPRLRAHVEAAATVLDDPSATPTVVGPLALDLSGAPCRGKKRARGG